MAKTTKKTPEASSDKTSDAKTEAKTEAKSEAKSDKTKSAASGEAPDAAAVEAARTRLSAAGRNDPCPCGSGKKYKKCHLRDDEALSVPPATAPDPQVMLANAWRLFEQRRPGAAEKEFRAALELKPDLLDARVGIGMARLSAGNADGAKEELSVVIDAGEAQAAELRAQNVKDAFTRPEAQPYIRACHAVGCLAYDQDRFADAVTDLAKVYDIDEGTVGTEARLIAAKALMKLEKPADAATVLEPAVKSETAGSRAQLGLALAYFVSGAEDKARAALTAALDANPHYGKTLLGRIRRRVDNIAGAQPGSVEEALLYAQTYGDVWSDDAKKFLEKALADKPAAPAPEPAPAAAD
jgi:tetratricopeptide (TPR) repeat protein